LFVSLTDQKKMQTQGSQGCSVKLSKPKRRRKTAISGEVNYQIGAEAGEGKLISRDRLSKPKLKRGSLEKKRGKTASLDGSASPIRGMGREP